MRKHRAYLGVLLLAGGTAAAQEKIRLGLHLQEGKTYGLRMVQEQIVSQTYMGQEQQMSQRLGVAYTFDVEQQEGGQTAWITATYRSLQLRIESPLGVAEYDSDNPAAEASEMVKGFAALTGQSIRMQITPQGRILQIEGVDAILERMMEAFEPQGAPAQQELEARLEAQFGKKALLESFGNIMAIYPETPVEAGESWTRRLAISQGLPMIFENTWTLRSRQDGVALLGLESQVQPNAKGKAVEMAGMKLRYNMSGQQTGQIELQESSGWIVRGSMALDFEGQVKVEGMDMEWPMSVRSTVRFEPYQFKQ